LSVVFVVNEPAVRWLLHCRRRGPGDETRNECGVVLERWKRGRSLLQGAGWTEGTRRQPRWALRQLTEQHTALLRACKRGGPGTYWQLPLHPGSWRSVPLFTAWIPHAVGNVMQYIYPCRSPRRSREVVRSPFL